MRTLRRSLRRGVHGPLLQDVGFRVQRHQHLFVATHQLLRRVQHIAAAGMADDLVHDAGASGSQQVGIAHLIEHAHRRLPRIALLQDRQTPLPVRHQGFGARLASGEPPQSAGHGKKLFKGLHLVDQHRDAHGFQGLGLGQHFLPPGQLQHHIRLPGRHQLRIGTHVRTHGRQVLQAGDGRIGRRAGHEGLAGIQRQQYFVERAVQGDDPLCGPFQAHGHAPAVHQLQCPGRQYGAAEQAEAEPQPQARTKAPSGNALPQARKIRLHAESPPGIQGHEAAGAGPGADRCGDAGRYASPRHRERAGSPP